MKIGIKSTWREALEIPVESPIISLNSLRDGDFSLEPGIEVKLSLADFTGMKSLLSAYPELTKVAVRIYRNPSLHTYANWSARHQEILVGCDAYKEGVEVEIGLAILPEIQKIIDLIESFNNNLLMKSFAREAGKEDKPAWLDHQEPQFTDEFSEALTQVIYAHHSIIVDSASYQHIANDYHLLMNEMAHVLQINKMKRYVDFSLEAAQNTKQFQLEDKLANARFALSRFEYVTSKVGATPFMEKLSTLTRTAVDSVKKLAINIPIGKKAIAAAMLAGSLAVGAISSQAADNPREQVYKSLFSRSTLATLNKATSLEQNTVVSYSGEHTEMASVINDEGVAESCGIVLDDEFNTNVATFLPGMTEEEVLDFVFLHEQAHCADYAHLFKFTDSYRELASFAKSETPVAESTINESFADAYALLTMMARNPKRANALYEAVSGLRKMEVELNHDAHVENDHDSTVALKFAYDAFKMTKGKLVFTTPEHQAQTEQAIGSLAGDSAAFAFKEWMDANPSSGLNHLQQWRENRRAAQVGLQNKNPMQLRNLRP